MDFSIKSEYGIVFVIAAVIIAAIASYFYYRRSTAPGNLKWLLSSLRFLSILFILLLFMSPVLSFLDKTENNPLNIILIDYSKSITVGDKEEIQKQISMADNKAGKDNDSRYFLFSDGIVSEVKQTELQNVNFDSASSNRTNLSKALRDLKENLPGQNISSVTVLSDGIFNGGGNPVQSGLAIGAPVNFLLVGDTISRKDISVTKVFYNKTAFIESSVPVSAEVKVNGFTGTIRVKLFEDGRLADTRELNVDIGKTTYNVDFTVSSPEQKTTLYRIEADSIDGEVTFMNNFRELFIKFIDNRFRILVLAGAPSADLAFAREQMKRIKNFEAEFRTQKAPGEYYEGAIPAISGFDAVFLFGYPTAISEDRILKEINGAVEKTNMPLIYFASGNTDFNKLKIIENNLPFTLASTSEGEEETSLSVVAGTASEFFRDQKIISDINGLPNIFRNTSSLNAKPNAQTLVVTNKGSSPALIVSRSSDRSSAAFLPFGIYKWRLGNNVTAADDVLGYLLANIVSSVARKDEGRKFTIETSSPVYSKDEDVIFNASITGFEIKGGEQIKVNVSGPSYQSSFNMTKISSKDFLLAVRMPAEGIYSFEAALNSESRDIETVTGKFLVGNNNFEYLETQPDQMLLNEVASATGGKKLNGLSESEIQSVYEESGRNRSNEILSSKSFDLNINPYYLGFIILFLSIEWFLRKRNNLP
ncbi:MAG: hypothetical protein IPG02_04300 [Ignavibacteria bacterium]|nr:hypothetical protein [Ignavibacteria bacterium]